MIIRKSKLRTEHEKQVFVFCQLLSIDICILGSMRRFRPAQARAASSGTWRRSWALTTRAGGEDYVNLGNKLLQIIVAISACVGGGSALVLTLVVD